MMNPMQPLDPQSPPDSVTPADSPSNPSAYAMVTPHGQGPAPYDIQAQLEDLTGAYQKAGADAGAGIVYSQSPRQAAAEALLESPQGFGIGGYSIQQGFSAGPGEGHYGWPNDMRPPSEPDNGGYGGA